MIDKDTKAMLKNLYSANMQTCSGYSTLAPALKSLANKESGKDKQAVLKLAGRIEDLVKLMTEITDDIKKLI